MSQKFAYGPVSLDPEDDENRQYHVKKTPSRGTWAAVVPGVVLLIVTISTVLWLKRPITQTCGTTPEEARAKDCYFDIMIGAWIPEPCADRGFSDAWSAEEEGLWFYDTNLTQPFPTSELRKGDHQLAYTRGNFHLKHCLYMWERTLRNIMNNQMLDDESISLVHARHCTGIYRGITPLRQYSTEGSLMSTSTLDTRDNIIGASQVWLMEVGPETRLEYTESATDYPLCQKPRWSGWSRVIVPGPEEQ